MTPKKGHYIPGEDATDWNDPSNLEKKAEEGEKSQETINEKYAKRHYPNIAQYTPRRPILRV